MILTALALAAAMAGDLYYDEAGCKWRHVPVAAKAHRPASAASAPRPKPRKTFAKPKAPADEFIGCDEAESVGRFSVLPPPPPMEFSPIPGAETFEPFLPVAAPPGGPVPSFETACECSGAGVPVFIPWPVPGPFLIVAGPLPPVTPIPEPGTLWLLLAGLAVVALRRRA